MDQGTIDFWKAQGPWAMLFVALLFVVGRVVLKMLADNKKRDDEHRSESKAREERLMNHNEKMGETLRELTATVVTIQRDVSEVKEEIEVLKRA